MIPLRDDNPSNRTPYVVYGLVTLNVLMFLAQLSGLLKDWSMIPYSAVHDVRVQLAMTQAGQMIGDQYGHAIIQTVPDGLHPQWITIFTSMFMHGGWLHIAGNMLYLWIFGNNVEDALGHVKFLIFYLLCGTLAALTHTWASGGFASASAVPNHPGLLAVATANAAVPTLGASGAIAGVLGAYIVLYPSSRIQTLIMLGWFWDTAAIPAIYLLGVWFLLQLIPGVTGSTSGGVAYWAHIGGFVFGALIILMLGGRKLIRPRRTIRPWNDDRPYPFRPWK